MLKRLCLLFIFCTTVAVCNAQIVYEMEQGVVDFHSDAPQELIKASSGRLSGAIDIAKKTFAFRVDIASFMGFNSPLQRDHFNENYMESGRFPQATFTGKIIEDVNLNVPGVYSVRAKGKINIHGIEQERIINGRVTVTASEINLAASFTVALVDHNIKIPRVVYEKLAPDINVKVKATLKPKR